LESNILLNLISLIEKLQEKYLFLTSQNAQKNNILVYNFWHILYFLSIRERENTRALVVLRTIKIQTTWLSKQFFGLYYYRMKCLRALSSYMHFHI